jgi:AAA family ATP:ADP antiporter
MTESPVKDRDALFASASIGVAAGFLFCGYEFIRTTSNTLFKESAPIGYGKEALPYIVSIVPFGVLLMVYGYGQLLTRQGPRRTLLVTSLLSGLGIAACYIAIRAGFRPARGILYVLREAYVVLLCEQYWSFLNSRLGTAAAKNLNGPICGLGSLGSIFGAKMVALYSVQLGTVSMIAFGAAAIVPAALLSDLAYKRCGEPAATSAEPVRKHDPMALSLFRSNRLLVLLLLIIFSTQTMAAVLDLAFQGRLQDAIPAVDAQNAYQGNFWFEVGLAAAFGQFILCPLLLRVLPLTVVHLIMPLVNLWYCVLAWRQPSLQSIGWAYLSFKVMDYSVFRAAKEILYIPFSFDVRYRAKEVIDVWGYRFGKGATGWLIALLKSTGSVVTDATYSAMACGAAAVWLVLIVPVCGAYKRHVIADDAAKLPLTDDPANADTP